MKNLLALLVGINDYPIASHRLSGCLEDIAKVDQFLSTHCAIQQLRYQPVLLLNEQATRQNIIDHFAHFEKALAGDICLLYYSGHGSRMLAPAAFWHLEPDRKLQSIVCYDSRLKDGRDLSDKEIGYLIWKYTANKNLHFVSIFDSCHSGGITRDAGMVYRMIESANDQQPLQKFEGYRDYSTDGRMVTPPVAPHIALSASRADEKAVEMILGGKYTGLFTHSLLEVLAQSALDNLNYHELDNRLQTKISNRYDRQHPVLSTEGGFDSYGLFLNGKLGQRNKSTTCFLKNAGWVISLGAMHGIQSGSSVQVIDRGQFHQAMIKTVEPSRSFLSGMDWADTTRDYPVRNITWKVNKVPIALDPAADLDSAACRALLAQLQIDPAQFFELHPTPETAKYLMGIDAAKGFILTRPGSGRPVFRGARIADPGNPQLLLTAILSFISNVEKVAHWEIISERNNPLSRLDLKAEIEIEWYRVTDHEEYKKINEGGREKLDPSPEQLFSYYYRNGAWQNPALQLSIRNIGHRTLWVGALYLAEDFSISDAVLPLKALPPQSEPYHFSTYHRNFNYTIIPLRLPDAIQKFGETTIFNQIKIFVSTTELNLKDLTQAGLELETNTGKKFKSLGFSEEEDAQEDWAVIDLRIKIHRPLTGQALIPAKRLQLQGLSIEPHDQLRAAQVRLASSSQVSRNLELPLPSLFFSGSNFRPVNLSNSRDIREPLDVVELHGLSDPDVVHADKPLIMSIDEEMPEDEGIIPFGFDKDLGGFYPLGYTRQDGKIIIEDLPDSSSSSERGLFKSIKIFLQKVWYKRWLKADHPYPILAVAEVNEAEQLQYISDPVQVSEAVAGARRILVLTHGLIGDTTNSALIMQRAKGQLNGQQSDLNDIYDLLLTFDYESLNTPIEQTARELKDRLLAVGIHPGHNKIIHLMGHSMGGLVGRWLLEKEGGDQLINHFVQVASPNLGSPWTKVYDIGMVAIGIAINLIPVPMLINSLLGWVGRRRKSIEVTKDQLKANSPFLKQLNASTPPIPYSVIPGNINLISAENLKEKKLLKRILRRFRRGIEAKLIASLFDEDNDAIVSLSSIVGVPKSGSVPVNILSSVGCTHFSYFNAEPSVEIIAKLLFELFEKENSGMPI